MLLRIQIKQAGMPGDGRHLQVMIREQRLDATALSGRQGTQFCCIARYDRNLDTIITKVRKIRDGLIHLDFGHTPGAISNFHRPILSLISC